MTAKTNKTANKQWNYYEDIHEIIDQGTGIITHTSSPWQVRNEDEHLSSFYF